jgi:hypothetical protein
MFGPYAALKLAELSEGVVLDCLSQLDECLARWKELLDPVTMAVVVSSLYKRSFSMAMLCAFSCFAPAASAVTCPHAMLQPCRIRNSQSV